MIKINDSLFLHGGISAKYVSTKIGDINEKVRQELKGDPAKLEGGIVIRRGTDCPGHTYADAAITPRFDRKVIQVGCRAFTTASARWAAW